MAGWIWTWVWGLCSGNRVGCKGHIFTKSSFGILNVTCAEVKMPKKLRDDILALDVRCSDLGCPVAAFTVVVW